MEKYLTAAQIAAGIGGVVWGSEGTAVSRIALSRESDENCVTYFNREPSKKHIQSTHFAVCIVENLSHIADGRTYIYTGRNIDEVLYRLVELFAENGFYSRRYDGGYTAPSASVGRAAVGDGTYIGGGTVIYDNVYIGNGVHIGEGCEILPNAVIHDDTVIGNNVRIQSGSVIGGSSFQYSRTEDGYRRIRNIGTVRIGDDIEIGSLVTVDRGTIGDTVIGNGTIVDNLVHIGHEVQIGNNCRICAQTGIAGWTQIGNNVTIYGQVGIANEVKIEDNCIILAKSGVSKNIPESDVVSGIPAKNNSEYLKEMAVLKRLLKERRE